MTTAPLPVVLATDGTSASAGALRYACQEARLRGADLHVVHVLPVGLPAAPLEPVVPLNLEPHGRAVLQHAVDEAARQAPGLHVTSTLVRDTRVHGIVRAAVGAGLLVVGRETRHGLERLLTGATTAGTAAHAGCTTVVVPDSWEPAVPDGRGPVAVVGVRTADGAGELLAAAVEWADRHDGTVEVVHTWEMADPYLDRMEAHGHAEEWEAAGRRVVDAALEQWPSTDRTRLTGAHVVHGQTAAVLAAAAGDAGVLFVRRAHDHRPWDHLGSTVRTLLLASPSPVCVVPTRPATKRREPTRDSLAAAVG